MFFCGPVPVALALFLFLVGFCVVLSLPLQVCDDQGGLPGVAVAGVESSQSYTEPSLLRSAVDPVRVAFAIRSYLTF